MKKNLMACITAMTLFAVLAIPARLAAQERTLAQEQKKEKPRYNLIDVAFGGPASYLAIDANGIGSLSAFLNNRGTAVGGADTSTPDPNAPNCSNPDCFVSHAFQWQKGVLTDLGALPGVNSSMANWISANGLIAGSSQNGVADPATGNPVQHAVLWKDGQISDLGGFGGFLSVAQAVNNRGQVVGLALNTIPDPPNPFGLVTQVRAFLWQNGAMQDLGTLGGNDANAFFVNERGQIVGQSFTNAIPNPGTGIPTQDPFLWENGTMLDLGTLGGTLGFPMALNNRGQVVGRSNLAGDLTFHPFLWDRGVLTDLGTLGGSFGVANWINEAGEVVGNADLPGSQTHHAFLWKQGVMTDLGALVANSSANGINSHGQIVGVSRINSTTIHAVLWEDGQIIDLNTFLPPGSGLQQLSFAFGINERGEIVGLGVPPGCGTDAGAAFACGRVFLLIPCSGDHADAESCEDKPEGTNPVIQSNPAPVIPHFNKRDSAQTDLRDVGCYYVSNSVVDITVSEPGHEINFSEGTRIVPGATCSRQHLPWLI